MCHARHHHHETRVARRPAEDPTLRASDRERESTVTLLREHGAAGRLDMEELEQRIGAAYEARTRGDLAKLLGDLPRSQPAPRQAQRSAGQDHDGWRAFALVNVLLVVIWAVSGAGYFWPAWVIVWWGLALTMRTAPRLLRLR